MNIKEIFKNAYPDTELERIYDFDGCEVGTMQRHDNGIIITVQNYTKFVDEYEIEKHLEPDVEEELINWINGNN